MWIRAQTANQRLKQNEHTQDAYGMQGSPVLYTKMLKAIIQQ